MYTRTAIVMVASAIALAPAAVPAPGATVPVAASEAGPVPGMDRVSRMVEIDGRFVTVSLDVTTVIPGAPLPDGSIPRTEVRLSVSIQDGAPLPEGLAAARVRFERVRAPQRTIFARLTPLPPTDTGEFELDRDDYVGEITGRFGDARRLRATVRLVIGQRVILVPMGPVRIGLLALP